jgi:hypothetical protein
MSRLHLWGVLTLSITVVLELLLILNASDGLLWMLTPWFELCRTVTPVAWQTRGNALLAVAWMTSGVVAYAAMLAALVVVVLPGGRRNPD